MTTLNELTNQHGTDLRVIFTDSDKTLHIIEDIENEVRAFVPDTSTPKGRKEIKSLAHKVSRSKTAIDSAGKDLVKGWKDQSKAVDADRKIIRDRLDALKNEVLTPVKKWEEEEAVRLRKEEIRKEILADMDQAKQLDALFDRELLLKKQEEDLRLREEELARAEKIAAEKERERLRIIDEEKRKEELKIEAEKEKADKLIKNQAIEKATAEQKNNKKRVRDEILADLVSLGVSDEQAKKAILGIEAGKVRNISINF